MTAPNGQGGQGRVLTHPDGGPELSPDGAADGTADGAADAPPEIAAPPVAPGAAALTDAAAARAMRRAVAGDDGAFATVIEQYDPLLRELVTHMLGGPAGMDEVLHDAYVKAYRALPRVTAPVHPGPWLLRIAYLVCLDELRRRYRHTDRLRKPAAPPVSDAAPPETPSAFSRAFSELPADYRAAVLLADRAGLSTAIVGDVLGLPEAAAAKKLSRARRLLHAALDADGPALELDA